MVYASRNQMKTLRKNLRNRNKRNRKKRNRKKSRRNKNLHLSLKIRCYMRTLKRSYYRSVARSNLNCFLNSFCLERHIANRYRKV
jgi:hypothetical protein